MILNMSIQLINSLTISNHVSLNNFGFSKQTMISSVIDDFFLPTFPLTSFIFYSSLNELDKTSSIMLNRSQDRGHLWFLILKRIFYQIVIKRCLQWQVLIDSGVFGSGGGWECVCRLRMFLLLRDLVLTMNQWWNHELLKINLNF